MITIQSTSEAPSLEADVEEDLQDFESWFKGLGNDPLVKGEVAILKTYLWWKLKGAQNGTEASQPDSV
jgi:hypothetical protein